MTETRSSGGANAVAAAIAIPAKDEAALLPRCLEALARQAKAPPFAVLVLANNCSDETASLARSLGPGLPYALHVREVSLPPGEQTAGHARRRAVDAVFEVVSNPDCVLLSTDADGEPEQDWVANTLGHIAAGADAVAGRAIIRPQEAQALPDGVRERSREEALLARMLDRIASLIDPVPWDPWPRHSGHWGANFAVTAGAYARSGGIPTVPLAEDRAFFAALERHDARIRHAEDSRVVVSARLQGRAPGGMADVLRRRGEVEDPLCDAILEPLGHALRRYRLRRALRHQRDGFDTPRNRSRLALDAVSMRWALDATSFGESWARLVEVSPSLVERRLPSSRLQPGINGARRILARLAPGEMPVTGPSEDTLV
ncbi:glycosyltransferase [Plastoroseomonas arctica]|uniref:Glycosyltransferase n=1 Tax=Plastoroseomonas arctica TaxID=1509237 RepID=A0AAF1K0N4_9PROT|nr:glycosyltransferase [Plastoroseomonas arctica]MBR0656828.1 glycosyltransferase [Plastoroseomonas arctica]